MEETSNREKIRRELITILGDRDTLRPEDVVSFAKRNRKSAIRGEFDKQNLFDDKVAAEKARLNYARSLIQRVKVRFITPDRRPVPLRVMVNLSEERQTPNRGYRLRSTVIEDDRRRSMFCRDFKTDIEALIVRYYDILSEDQEKKLREIAYEVSELG